MSELNAIIYCRVSSERQKNEGHGLDSQEQRCRLYCGQKQYKVERVFRDSFTGAGDFMERPAMGDLLAYLDKHPHRDNYVVVFDDLKRFARDTVFHLKLRREFKARGVKVECLNYKFDESEEGEFIETVLAAQGELERKQNRRQVIQKQKARLEAGYWPFCPPPGYRQPKTATHGKLLTPYEPEATNVRTALEGFATDRFETQADMARYLGEQDFIGKSKVPFQLANRLLARVWIYAGFIQYEPWEVVRRQGHHQPLIDLATYQKILRKIEGRSPVRTRADMREDFPLRHTQIACGNCGRPFTASYTTKKKGYRRPYYRCANTACPEHTKSIPVELIETQFRTMLQEIRPKPLVLKISEAMLYEKWEKRVAERADGEKRETGEIAGIQTEIRDLSKLARRATSERVRREYEKQIEELAAKEEKLTEKNDPAKKPRIEFRTALQMVFDYLKDPYNKWIEGDLSEKNMVLNLVFEGLVFYDRGFGFRTAPLCLPLRVFEHFATSKSQGVEAGGIEPPCKDNADGPSTSVV